MNRQIKSILVTLALVSSFGAFAKQTSQIAPTAVNQILFNTLSQRGGKPGLIVHASLDVPGRMFFDQLAHQLKKDGAKELSFADFNKVVPSVLPPAPQPVFRQSH